jgi:hypothetical protein
MTVEMVDVVVVGAQTTTAIEGAVLIIGICIGVDVMIADIAHRAFQKTNMF